MALSPDRRIILNAPPARTVKLGTTSGKSLVVSVPAPRTLILGPNGTQVLVLAQQGVQGPPGAMGSPGSALPPINFSYGDASPSVLYTLAVNSVITRCTIVIRTPFNGAGASLSVGTTGSPSLIQTTSQNAPGIAGQYASTPDAVLPAGTQIKLTIAPGSAPSAGSGIVIIELLAT